MNKKISIITNFGCDFDCWYCVWKKHQLKDVKLETDWEKLYLFLNENKNKGKVSVSGGGDCLYKYDENKGWWNKLFSLCKELNLLVDIHSKKIFYNIGFWKKINKVVISSDKLKNDLNYLLWILNYTQLRIVHVVTSESTEKDVLDYFEFTKQSKCQLTFKKITGYDDNGNYEIFKKLYPELFFLDEGDYNIYYMPNNTIKNKFL